MLLLIYLSRTAPPPPPENVAGYALVGWGVAVLFFSILMWMIKRTPPYTKSVYDNFQALWRKKMAFVESEAKYQKTCRDTLAIELERAGNRYDALSAHSAKLKEYIRTLDPAFEKIEKVRHSAAQVRLSRQNAFTDAEIRSFVMSISLCMERLFAELEDDAPGLGDIDKAMFGLIAMNIKPADIAILLSLSEGTLRQRKFRLKNKLSNPRLLDVMNGESEDDVEARYKDVSAVGKADVGAVVE